MASIRQVSEKKWRAEICVYRNRASASFPTKAQAEEWASEMEAFIRMNRQNDACRPPISVQEKLAFAKSKIKAKPVTRVLPRGKTLTDFGLPEVSSLFKESFESTGDFSGLYFLFHDETVVYVGQSLNVFCRVSRHMENKVFNRFAVLRCKPEELLELESIYISVLKPMYNKTDPLLEIRGHKEPLKFDENMLKKVRKWGRSAKRGKSGEPKSA